MFIIYIFLKTLITLPKYNLFLRSESSSNNIHDCCISDSIKRLVEVVTMLTICPLFLFSLSTHTVDFASLPNNKTTII